MLSDQGHMGPLVLGIVARQFYRDGRPQNVTTESSKSGLILATMFDVTQLPSLVYWVLCLLANRAKATSMLITINQKLTAIVPNRLALPAQQSNKLMQTDKGTQAR